MSADSPQREPATAAHEQPSSPADLQLQQRLQAATRFSWLQHVSSCESTQDAARQGQAGSGVYWADEQVGGRGRQGRLWSGAARRDVEVTFRIDGLHGVQPAQLAAAVPVAVLTAVETACARRLTFKWPNDIFADGRKLCGTLIDYHGPSEGSYSVGIGLNGNRTSFPPELREQATSLTLLAGHEFDRHDLVYRIGASLDAVCEALVGKDLEPYARMLRARANWFQRVVRVEPSGMDPVVGRVTELDLDRMHVVADGAAAGVDIPLAVVNRIDVP